MMTALISSHEGLITRRSIFIGTAGSLLCACHRAGRESNAGAPLESTD
jgi:arginine utilization protein RocB